MTSAMVENQPTVTEPGPAPKRPDPAEVFKPSPALIARLEGLRRAAGPGQDHPVPPDDPAERRREVARMTWENSLRAGHATDLAHWRLDTLATDQHPVQLRKYVEHIAAAKQGGSAAKILNLVLGGRVGPGKTSAAIAAGHAAAEAGLLTRFVRHADYLTWLTPDGSPPDLHDWQIERRYRDCDLLILDDLGAGLDPGQPASEFKRTQTLRLIGDRINSGKATIVTTNEAAEVTARDAQGVEKLTGGLALMFGAQVISRLSERGHALRFVGPDRRGRLSW